AAQSGHLKVVQLLVEKNFKINARDKDGDTPAMRAASCNHLEVVQYLQQHGAVLADQVNTEGVTPLHVAAERGFTGMITFLLGKKLIADVNATNDLMTTPLHVAVRVGNCYTVKTLLEAGADVNAQDVEGYTPVHIA
ncbi:ankyrin, partial [Cadophora sp. DSE1049]